MNIPLCRWLFMEAPGFLLKQYQHAIRYGAAKFNVGTILKKSFVAGIRESVLALDE